MRHLISMAIAGSLAACIPLKQTRITGGLGYDYFGYYGQSGYGLLQIGASNAPKQIILIDSRSFALSPKGIRFRVQTEPHPYDLETKSSKAPYIRDRVYVLDSQ